MLGALPRRAHLHPEIGEGQGQGPCPELPKEGRQGKAPKAEEQCPFMALFLKGKVTETGMSAALKREAKPRLQQYKVSGLAEGHTKVTFMVLFLKGKVTEMVLCPPS